MKKILIVILFLSVTVLTAQTTQDFKINSDNLTPTYKQMHPKLYNCKDKGFLVVWSDYRTGDLKYYAQYFDSLGNKINNNFEIVSNYDVAFASEESFLVLTEETYSYQFPFESSGFELSAVKYRNFKCDNNSQYLTGGSYPWCGTGWLGYKHFLEYDDNNYNFFFGSDGNLNYSVYNENLELIYGSQDTLDLPNYTGNYAVALNDSNKAIFFINSYNYEMPVGYYFTLINSNNEITAANIPVKVFDESEYTEFYDYGIMEIASLSDSLYLLLWRDYNDDKVSYMKIKSNGEIIDSLKYIELPFPQGSFNYKGVERILKVKNKFSTTPIIIESNYKLMSESSGKKSYTIVYFDETGNIIRSTVSETDNLTISNKLFSKDENTFFNVFSDNKDIYLQELSDLNETSVPVKINDGLTGISGNINSPNKKLSLSQNYPNPFNPTTVISYSLAESGRTRVIVYDILGNEVETLVNQFQPAGNYKIEFNASTLSSGVYFYRIITSDFTAVKKMILLR